MKKKYIELEKELDNVSDKVERSCILKDLSFLKKRAFGLPKNTYALVKECISNAGYIYYDANEEADTLCVKLVQEKAAWGCLSDDMDMFVFECPFVIRQFQLSNETFMFYKKEEILNELQMSFPLFKQMCVLSGTDYNIHDNNISLNETLKWLKEYNKTDNDAIDAKAAKTLICPTLEITGVAVFAPIK